MPSTDLVPASDYESLQPATLELVHSAIGTGQLREFDLKRVRMASGGQTFWTVPGLDGDEALPQIEGVILHNKTSRTYWEKPYTGGSEPPDCASRNATVAQPRQLEDGDPDDEPEYFQPPAQRIGEQAGTPLYSCESCAFAQWGTKIRDGKATRGQACKLSRQLFMLHPARRLPLVISLPPTSLKVAQDYLLDLLDYGLDPAGIITVISLEKVAGQGVPDYAKAVFRRGDALSSEQTALAKQYGELLSTTFDTVVAERADVDGEAAAQGAAAA